MPAGEVLARVGEVARQFIAVVDGYVEVTDQRSRPSVAGAWTQIGATELLTGEQHRATVTTRSEATLVVIFGPAFKSAITLSALASERGGVRSTRAIVRAARTDDAPTTSPHASVPALVD